MENDEKLFKDKLNYLNNYIYKWSVLNINNNY